MLIVGALLCLSFPLSAQKPLQLHAGDKAPATFWTTKHEIYEKGVFKTRDLSEYKDKLLILDFWATWCTACFGKMETLATLTTKYPQDLRVLLVNASGTGYDHKEISERIDGVDWLKRKFELSTVVLDSTLIKHFPTRVLPRYVWIIDGSIHSITSSEFVDADNVERVLAMSARNKASAAKFKRKPTTNKTK